MELKRLYVVGLVLAFVLGNSYLRGQSENYEVLAHYALDSGTAFDSSGNGYHGQVMGNPKLDPGILNNGLSFDGVDDYILIPSNSNLTTDSITVSFWMRMFGMSASRMVLLERVAQNVGYRIELRGQNPTISFQVLGSSGDAVTVRAPFPIEDGVWTPVVASYDGDVLRLYLHGELVATRSAPGLDFGQYTSLLLARSKTGSFYDGELDNVVIASGAPALQSICESALKKWEALSETCVENFYEVTHELGVGDTLHAHFALCMLDINNDGWLDLYYANGRGNPTIPIPPSGTCPPLQNEPPYSPANPNALFLGNGDGTFSDDVAPAAGLDDYWFAMRNVFADYDNDGLKDMLSHNFLVSPLYRAISDDPLLYEDVSGPSGTRICLGHGTGASFVDLDNDGFLDIYAVEYDANRAPSEHVNQMFLNNGNGTFTDITAEAGVDLPDNPMGITFADYDNDGDQDVYVSNSHAVPARLYRNEGIDTLTGLPHFIDVAAPAGVNISGEAGRGFGSAWGDYDNDGRLDLLFAREGDSRLFHNEGPNADGVWTFTDVTNTNGLIFTGTNLSFQDGIFADIDNDGALDILMASGALNGPNQVFLNRGADGWIEVSNLLGMDLPRADADGPVPISGIVPGDYDNDGDLDLLWMGHQKNEPNYLFRNESRGNNWIQFRLTGVTSNRDAVGARIKLQAILSAGEDPVVQMREVVAGTGFFSDIPRIQTFGLGKATEVLDVRIIWPSGLVQSFSGLEINQRHDIVEGETSTLRTSKRRTVEAPATTASVASGAIEVATIYQLEQNYPNPFNPTTTIRFQLPEKSIVSLTVYDVIGRLVRRLVYRQTLEANFHQITWNGRDDSGNVLPSGVYILRMKADDYSATRKMFIAR